MTDLGNWASEHYRLAGASLEIEEEQGTTAKETPVLPRRR